MENLDGIVVRGLTGMRGSVDETIISRTGRDVTGISARGGDFESGINILNCQVRK